MYNTDKQEFSNEKSWREAEWDNPSEKFRFSSERNIDYSAVKKKWEERQYENLHWQRDSDWEFEMIPLWYTSLSLFLSDEKIWASAEHAECGERNRKFYKAEKLF